MNDQTPDLPLPLRLTPERVDALADLTVKGMEGGLQGFCTYWGWQQFARALLENFDRAVHDYALAAIAADRAMKVKLDDEAIELAGALQVRRILNEIKEVAAMRAANDSSTSFEAAWAQCCEEIFHRATDRQWRMNEDATRFAACTAIKPEAQEGAN